MNHNRSSHSIFTQASIAKANETTRNQEFLNDPLHIAFQDNILQASAFLQRSVRLSRKPWRSSRTEGVSTAP